MSLKNLEQHQNINKRDGEELTGFYKKLTLKQQQEEKQKQIDRRKNFKVKAKPETRYFNHIMKSVLVSEITPELLEAEEEWAITYLDYLKELK